MSSNQTMTPTTNASRTATTMRTGLTEMQLRDMSTAIQQNTTPIHSEIVNKRRRLDSVIDRNNEFLSRQGNDDSASGASFMNMMIMQSNQRDIRSEEWRREDVARDIRRQAEMDRKEEAENRKEELRIRSQIERDEQRQRDKEMREDIRRKDDLDREERREKADKERSDMMLMFLTKK